MDFRMTVETMSYMDTVRSDQTFWSEVFDIDEGKIYDKGHLPRTLQVSRSLVLTAKLNVTVDFFKAMESQTFSRLPGNMGDLGSVLDVFTILATFDSLCRARYGELKQPSFWIRNKANRKLSPVLQIDIAARMTGLTPASLRACLVPLIKDGAVEFVKAPDGVVGVRVNEGFLNDTKFKKYYTL
jgi:hypothetical protein